MSHYIHDDKVKELEELANKIRQSLVEELVEAFGMGVKDIKAAVKRVIKRKI